MVFGWKMLESGRKRGVFEDVATGWELQINPNSDPDDPEMVQRSSNRSSSRSSKVFVLSNGPSSVSSGH